MLHCYCSVPLFSCSASTFCCLLLRPIITKFGNKIGKCTTRTATTTLRHCFFSWFFVHIELQSPTNGRQIFQDEQNLIFIHLPNGISQSRQVAAKQPADAPLILSSSKCGAYFLKQTATPTW